MFARYEPRPVENRPTPYVTLPASAQRCQIKTRGEETQCSYCGLPLGVGDQAIVLGTEIYCSGSCLKSDRLDVEQLREMGLVAAG